MAIRSVPISRIMGATSAMVFGPPFGPGEMGIGYVKQAMVDAAAVDRLEQNIKSFKVPLEESLREVVQPSIVKNFAAQGRPRWMPLSEATLRSRGWTPMGTVRRKHLSMSAPMSKGGFKILDRTGRLKRAATQLNMWEVTETELKFRVTFFSGKVPYGPFHQLGTDKMYARQFITLGAPNDEDKIRLIFDQWLIKRIEKYWGSVQFGGDG